MKNVNRLPYNGEYVIYLNRFTNEICWNKAVMVKRLLKNPEYIYVNVFKNEYKYKHKLHINDILGYAGFKRKNVYNRIKQNYPEFLI